MELKEKFNELELKDKEAVLERLRTEKEAVEDQRTELRSVLAPFVHVVNQYKQQINNAKTNTKREYYSKKMQKQQSALIDGLVTLNNLDKKVERLESFINDVSTQEEE